MSSVYHIGLPFTVSRTSTVVRYRLPPSSGGHEEKVLDRRLQDLKTKTSQDMLSLARRAHEQAVSARAGHNHDLHGLHGQPVLGR